MTNEELLSAVRTTVREEVNSAVYASEQRLGERLDKIETRLDHVETRLNKLEGMVIPMVEHVKLLRTAHRESKSDLLDIRNEFTQAILVLNEATLKINDIQRSQVSLEMRVEENIKGLRYDLQLIVTTLQTFTKEFNAIVRETHARLDLHESTPIDETHPGSAA